MKRNGFVKRRSGAALFSAVMLLFGAGCLTSGSEGPTGTDQPAEGIRTGGAGGNSTGASLSPAEGLERALEALAADHYKAQVSTLRTLPGSVTWGESGVGSEFSLWFLREMTKALAAHGRYSPVSVPGPVFGHPQAALTAGPDRWGSAEYLLSGSCRLGEGAVVVDLTLFSFIFEEPVGSAQVQVPLRSLPGGMEVVPADQAALKDLSEELGTVFGESDLDIYVTTGRGEGGVYRVGEELTLYLLASRSCYVKVFHISGDGEETVQVFPNRYEQNNRLEGGRYLKFPGDASAFRFRLTPPTGAEFIKVVASTAPFPGGKPFQDMGRATRGLMLEAVDPEEEQVLAEGQVSYTILPAE